MTAQILDLTSRLDRGARAMARVAAEPVRHVTPEFLAALHCLDIDELRAWTASESAAGSR